MRVKSLKVPQIARLIIDADNELMNTAISNLLRYTNATLRGVVFSI